MKALKKLLDTHRKLIDQFCRFVVIGLIVFTFDYALFHLALNVFGFNRYGSALFSFPFSSFASWVGNRLFTFRGDHSGSAHAQLMRFFVVTGIGIVLNRGTFSLLTAFVPLVYAYPILGLMAGTGVGMFFNFFVARRMVFR